MVCAAAGAAITTATAASHATPCQRRRGPTVTNPFGHRSLITVSLAPEPGSPRKRAAPQSASKCRGTGARPTIGAMRISDKCRLRESHTPVSRTTPLDAASARALVQALTDSGARPLYVRKGMEPAF